MESTVRIANLATDDEAVLRNADYWRKTIAPLGVSAEAIRAVELAETCALRRLGKDIWPKKHVLLRDALAVEMPMNDRRRAARTFIVAAEESFGGAEALTVLPSLASLWENPLDLDALEL